MYVNSIDIANLRSIKRASGIVLRRPGGSIDNGVSTLSNVNLLMGVNGSGKTTMLKAIALAVLGNVIRDSGYRPYYLVRRESAKVSLEKCKIKAELSMHGQEVGGRWATIAAASFCTTEIRGRGDYESIRVPSTPKPPDSMFDDSSPAFFLVGYGATRRVEQVEHLASQSQKSRGVRYQRVAGLFEEYIALRPLGVWLPEAKLSHPQRFQEVKSILRQVIPLPVQFTDDFEEFDPLFDVGGVTLPFGALSDGYRSFIGLVGDLLYHLHDVCPTQHKLAEMTGVVLIDDVDLHLHPKWQRVVVPTLAKAFPKLQFVVTSHSPLVASTLHADNIFMMDTSNPGETRIIQIEEPVFGRSTDQILTSAYFNLTMPRGRPVEKRLAELARDMEQRGNPDDAIAFLEQLTGKSEHSGE